MNAISVFSLLSIFCCLYENAPHENFLHLRRRKLLQLKFGNTQFTNGHNFSRQRVKNENTTQFILRPLSHLCNLPTKASSTFEAALAAKVLYFCFHRLFGSAELERAQEKKPHSWEKKTNECIWKRALLFSQQPSLAVRNIIQIVVHIQIEESEREREGSLGNVQKMLAPLRWSRNDIRNGHQKGKNWRSPLAECAPD